MLGSLFAVVICAASTTASEYQPRSPVGLRGQAAIPKVTNASSCPTRFERWSSIEVGGRSDLMVVSSTKLGTFALTGLVLGSGGRPVVRARVRLSRCRRCQTGLSAVTGANGTFAFVNADAQLAALKVTAPGYGAWISSLRFHRNQTYQLTMELTATRQAFD